ncbi:Chromosome stability protein 9 [Candida viswanathii]|uniref:Chromosome stability protein 9 n=1 Tax=Candida viswanathii TaxID=5486 RepID=A0A367XL03_9ASCO|nr:Chromosome stability protein 9 [Candida viswanathii]
MFMHVPELYVGELDSLVCPVCRTPNISTVPINTALPDELRTFFIPTPQQIDLLNSSGKFQYCALMDRINHYKSTITKLNEKIKKQKEFLYAAKEEITHLSKYKSQVEELNQEIASLKMQLNESKRPDTFDLSTEDADSGIHVHHNNSFLPQHSPPLRSATTSTVALQTFIEKVHKQSSQKVIPSSRSNNSLKSSLGHRYSDVPQKPSFFAESTKIGELNSNSHSSSASSNGSSSHSLNRFSYTKPSRARPSTSQIASRITANMKVGTPLGSSGTVLGSYGPSRVSKAPTLTRTSRRASGSSPYFSGSSQAKYKR